MIEGIASAGQAWQDNAMNTTDRVYGHYKDMLNYQNQREQQQYERQMQKQAWAREDTAVQRRAADLKAAGLSPLLAAGSAAGSMAPVHTGTQTIRSDGNPRPIADPVAAYLATTSQKAEIARTEAQNKLLEIQQLKAKEEVRSNILDNKMKEQDLHIATESGTGSHPGIVTETVRQLSHSLQTGLQLFWQDLTNNSGQIKPKYIRTKNGWERR